MSSNLPPTSSEPLSQNSKGLLALVIFLGILIVVATTVLIGVIISRITHHTSANHATVQNFEPITQVVSVLGEPQETRITQIMRQSDNRLVMHLVGGGADRLVIWDIAQQKKIAEIRLFDQQNTQKGK